MKIEIRGKGRQLSVTQRERAERTMTFALDHMVEAIRSVEIRMGSDRAPSGELSRCDVTVRLARGGRVLVSEVATGVMESIDRAAESAARRVVKTVSRRRRRTSETLRHVA